MTERKTVGSSVVAKALNVSAQYVRRLAADGVIPRVGPGQYELGLCVAAYIRYLQASNASRGNPADENSPTGQLKAEKLRATRLDNELKEVELAKARGSLITVEDHERFLEVTLARVRARVVNWPGLYANRTVGLRSVAESLVFWEQVSSEALATLQSLADEPEEEVSAGELDIPLLPEFEGGEDAEPTDGDEGGRPE